MPQAVILVKPSKSIQLATIVDRI